MGIFYVLIFSSDSSRLFFFVFQPSFDFQWFVKADELRYFMYGEVVPFLSKRNESCIKSNGFSGKYKYSADIFCLVLFVYILMVKNSYDGVTR